MKKFFAILLAMVLLVCLIACGTKPQQGEERPMPEEVTVENPATFVSLSYGLDYENVQYLTAYPNEEGGVHVEYSAEEKKIGEMEAWVLHGMAAELAKTALPALNGQDSYEEGEATASMYVEYADGTVLSASFSGTIPEEFVTGYETMSTYFRALTSALPIYVPQPQILGEIDETLLTELTALLSATGIESLDTFTLAPVPVDDSLPYAVGLSTAEGVAAAASCTPMMMTTAYGLNVVALEDESAAEAVAADFESNLDWRKWVCVAPSEALIAVKDNLVLCLMADENLYAPTVEGILASGWTELKTLKNPDL